MSSLQKLMAKSKLPPLPPSNRMTKLAAFRKRDYTPLQWDKYFDQCQDVEVDGNTFRVYTLGNEGPALVLLHGGGLSALGWSLFAVAVTKLVKCRVVAIDQRGHGSTQTSDDNDLSAATLAADVGAVLRALWPVEAPSVVLMGHSMGGAIAIHAAVKRRVPSLSGLVVIDVVEGTAVEALGSMQSFLRSRPKTFKSLEEAIEWCVRSGQVRNVESARVAMPGQIINIETGKLGIHDIGTYTPAEAGDSPVESRLQDPNQIAECSEESGDEATTTSNTSSSAFKPPSEIPKAKYQWRIDLSRTDGHWPGWFAGMSELFLSVDEPKLLILAGIDTLDKELMVGQMQGRFQLQVLPKCGHAVHEDVPDQVAELLAAYLVRLRLAEPTADFHRPFPAC